MKLINTIELLLLAAIWGASFLFMRVAAPEFGPVPLIGLRVGLAALVLLPLFLMRYPLNSLARYNGRMMIVGIFNSALPFSLFAYASLHLISGINAVLNATVSIFSAAIAYAWLRERLSLIRVVGLLVGFCGVCALAFSTGAFDQSSTTLAVLAGLAASLSYALSTCYVKQNLKGIDSLTLTTSSMIGAAIGLLPFTLIYWPTQELSLHGWFSAISLAIVCTGLAFILYFRLLTQVGVANTTTVTLAIPLFAMIWGTIWLDEVITVGMGASSVIIIVGAVLAANLLNVNQRISQTWFRSKKTCN